MYSYFKQLFAQVTNPPIDPIREAVVMSVQSLVGSERNLLDETPEHARQLVIENPILRDEELERLRQVDSDVFKAQTIDFTWPVAEGADGLEPALERICAEADAALAAGVNILIVSDRNVGPERVAMPSLLAVGAIHHHLVRAGTRLQAGLVVESGEPRSVQSVAVLIGYGAAAVNPYLMLATVGQLVAEGRVEMLARGGGGACAQGGRQGPPEDDLEDGHLDTLVVLRRTGLRGGRPLGRAHRQALHRHPVAHRRHRQRASWRRARSCGTHAPIPARAGELLPVVGLYAWRRDGEHHQWNPETIALLQHAVRGGGRETYKEFAALVNDDSARRSTLRGLLRFREQVPIPLEEVEPASRDREALLDRCDVARLALARGARDARRRDEPDRRPLEHRRGRRGPGAVPATSAARRSSRSPRAASA